MIQPPEPTDELLGVLHLASELAGRLRHAEVTPEHVLMAMARNPTAAQGLVAGGVDPRRMEADLREFLLETGRPARAWQLLGPSYAPALRRVLDQTLRRLAVAGRAGVGVGEVLAALLREEVPPDVAVQERGVAGGGAYREGRQVLVHPIHRLRQSSLRMVDLLAWVAHGAVPPAVTTGADRDPVAVVLHNDDYTPFDLVRDILRTELGMPGGEAEAVMRAAHVHGHERIVGFLRADASDRVDRAVSRARAAGFPLRLTVEDQ